VKGAAKKDILCAGTILPKKKAYKQHFPKI